MIYEYSENQIKRYTTDYIPWLFNVIKSFKKTLNFKQQN